MKRKKILISVVVLPAIAISCSSDPDTPLGYEFMEDGTLGSRPGSVLVDTLYATSADTSFAVSSTMTRNTFLALGIKEGYETSMLLRADLSQAGEDTAKIVLKASLRLRLIDQSQQDVIIARFYELLAPFTEGDTITSLPPISVDAIPDSGLVNVDREMKLLGNYTLPRDLVQAWIRGDSIHHGIAVIPADTTTEKQITFGSRENGDPGLQPFLSVDFTDGTSTNYPMSDDATFVQSVRSSANLVVSDGFARRVFIPVPLDSFPANVTIHRAELILDIVPGTVVGNEFGLFLYTPDAPDPGSRSIWEGIGITRVTADPDTGRVILPITNMLGLMLRGVVPDNGFVLQFDDEGTQIRQIEFNTASGPPGKRPRIGVTYSTPPEFMRVER